MEYGTPVASEAEVRHEPLSLGVVAQHLAIEALSRGPLVGIAQGGARQLAPRRSDDGAVAVPDQNVETEIGGVHRRLLDLDASAQLVDLV